MYASITSFPWYQMPYDGDSSSSEAGLYSRSMVAMKTTRPSTGVRKWYSPAASLSAVAAPVKDDVGEVVLPEAVFEVLVEAAETCPEGVIVNVVV